MATITRKVCDLCQQEGHTADGDVLRISLGGLAHEADVCDTHRAEIIEALAPFTKVMRAPSRRVPDMVDSLGRRPREPRERCPNCGRMFTGQGLASHRNSCRGEAFVYECDHPSCDYECMTAQGLAMHRYRKHGIMRADAHSCPRCKASFIQQETLERHVKKEHQMDLVGST